MDVSSFIICIYMIKVLTICSQVVSTSGQTGPGISSCFYFANIDTFCNLTAVGVDKLPESCTSFFAYELIVDLDYTVYAPPLDNYNYDFLKTLGQSGKNLYMAYSHTSFSQTTSILDGGSTCAMNEINNLNGFMEYFPGITGIVISDLDAVQMTEEYCGFTDKLLKYIELVKQETKLEVALCFDGEYFIDYYENPQFAWLDFPTLNSCVDFYVITLVAFNEECTEDLRDTGVAPLTGNAYYTLEKLECAIEKSKIPKNKLYFWFSLRPTMPLELNDVCVVNYHTLCNCPDSTKDWCSDTQQTYYEKGQWVSTNGAGFIGSNVDLDDAQNCCKCGPFPSFRAILAGVTGYSPPPMCPLFDRQP